MLHSASPWARLAAYFSDAEVDEVLVNGATAVYVERGGVLHPRGDGWSSDEIQRVVQHAVAPLGLSFDRAHPIVDARLPDGSRLHAVAPPVALDGPYLSVRRFRTRVRTLEHFGVGAALADRLRSVVSEGASMLVAGGTSTGKSTLLNILASFIPHDQRVVTIEENAELRLHAPHVVRLEARTANAEGAGAVSVRELVRAAMRMRPDRIVVGEVRGPEAYDLLQALNTGHSGVVATIHANDPASALVRLGDLVSEAGEVAHIAASRAEQAFDVVVQVGRQAGARRIVDVRFRNGVKH